MKSPYPYFGGKSTVASHVWERLGDTPNYVEPFFGSGAVLLERPVTHRGGIETVNDLNGYIANFWRAVKADPNAVAGHADWPVNENDLHARHIWLVNQRDDIQSRLEGDPDWYDAKIAGWWVWGMACWIGGGFCSGKGPWRSIDGQLVHLGDAGRGVNRQRVHLTHRAQGINAIHEELYDYMAELSERFRHVRVCCGDWLRVCGPTPTFHNGMTGVFLDPPYSAEAGRDPNCYGHTDDLDIAHAVREWAIEAGKNPMMRIALCGYDGEHEMSSDWKCSAWKARGGYASQGDGSNQNARRERIWFSPHCLNADLFQWAANDNV